MNAAITPFEAIAGASVAFLARHRHVDGNLATPSNTSAIQVRVVGDGAIGETLNTALTPVSTYVFATLQTADSRWPLDVNDDDDEQGYNFRYVAPPTAFPSQGHYRVEFKITHTDESVTKIVFEGPVRSSST